ncbi:hypothetical protein BJY04DRAFT_232006 [Aspergillus karnatakaensis]|uniref:uncharacterized protein n=1 Tax=Aspergillus karnatakaensis TaxID=1810916 RepID=UPI003CCDD7B7
MPSLKHRPQNHRSFHPPPLFWDKLTKFWLTKSALREANRQQDKPLSPDQGSCCSSYTFAPDFLRNCSATSLQEIREFSRCGGPDLSDLRDYPAPAHLSQCSMDSTDPSAKRIPHKRKPGSTAYDPHFEEHLIDHGIFMPSSTYPNGTEPPKPENIANIRQKLKRPRSSIALSEGSLEKEWEKFTKINDKTADEQGVIKKIIPILEGSHQDSVEDAGNHSFTNFAPLTNGTLANAKPDIYHGARPNQLSPRIRKHLSNKIIPTRRSNRPITPNFFVEAKGHDGSPAVVKRQACYDAALGARAMHALQQYGHDGGSDRPNDYDNNAYTIAATFQAGTLGLYATHPTRATNNDDPNRQTDYVMTQIGHYSLIGSPESYQQGLNAYRNSRDLAREIRNGFIEQANERFAAVVKDQRSG